MQKQKTLFDEYKMLILQLSKDEVKLPASLLLLKANPVKLFVVVFLFCFTAIWLLVYTLHQFHAQVIWYRVFISVHNATTNTYQLFLYV